MSANNEIRVPDIGDFKDVEIIEVHVSVGDTVAGFAQTWSLGVIGERIVARLRAQVFDRLVTLELDFYVKRRVGELISRLSSDVTQVRTMLTQTLTSLLSSTLSLVGSIVVLFLLSPNLLVVVLVLAPAIVVIAVVFARPLRRLSTRVQDSIAASTTTAEEALSGIRVVKSFGREEWERHRYNEDLRGVVGMATRLVTWRGLFGGMMTFLGFGTLIILLWFTGHAVIEGTISHRVFRGLISPEHHKKFEGIIFGLAKGAAITMFVYYFFKALLFIHGKQWALINDVWGLWFLVEVLGFVLVPGFMFAFGYKHRSLPIIRIASVLALLGVILNRLNVSVIAFKWYADVHYYPSWQEIVVTLMIICAEIWILRWMVTRMPVLNADH